MVRVIPRLVENLNKHGYVEMEKAVRVSNRDFPGGLLSTVGVGIPVVF
jgi:hypothetical protein